MSIEHLRDLRLARRAYELGRLRTSSVRALPVLALVAIGAWITGDRGALPLLALTFAAWVFVFWRGDVLLRGALFGLWGGLCVVLAPRALLASCCDADSFCGLSEACLAVGAAVGLVVAAAVPFARRSWWRTALGLALGLGSVVAPRCSSLLLGEALGLAGGIAAGAAASLAARLALAPRTAV